LKTYTRRIIFYELGFKKVSGILGYRDSRLLGFEVPKSSKLKGLVVPR
jgi:hypothetical protein